MSIRVRGIKNTDLNSTIRVLEENQMKIIAKFRDINFQKRSHTVEVQIAMRYKRIENSSDHLQSNFQK